MATMTQGQLVYLALPIDPSVPLTIARVVRIIDGSSCDIEYIAPNGTNMERTVETAVLDHVYYDVVGPGSGFNPGTFGYMVHSLVEGGNVRVFGVVKQKMSIIVPANAPNPFTGITADVETNVTILRVQISEPADGVAPNARGRAALGPYPGTPGSYLLTTPLLFTPLETLPYDGVNFATARTP